MVGNELQASLVFLFSSVLTFFQHQASSVLLRHRETENISIHPSVLDMYQYKSLTILTHLKTYIKWPFTHKNRKQMSTLFCCRLLNYRNHWCDEEDELVLKRNIYNVSWGVSDENRAGIEYMWLCGFQIFAHPYHKEAPDFSNWNGASSVSKRFHCKCSITTD